MLDDKIESKSKERKKGNGITLTDTSKKIIQKGMSITNRSFSNFVITSALKEAERLIKEQEQKIQTEVIAS